MCGREHCERDGYVVWIMWDHERFFQIETVGPDVIDVRDLSDGMIVLCEACGSEGRIYSGHPDDPNPTDCGPCPVCDGTGEAVIKAFPCDETDLDELDAIGALPGLELAKGTHDGECKLC